MLCKTLFKLAEEGNKSLSKVMIANDLIKAFLVAWWGESLTGVDSVCNGKAR